MRCRECGEELPLDSLKICPRCGVRQDTYITPRRNYYEKGRRSKVQKGTKLSFLSIALVVIVALIAVPMLRERNKQLLLSDIEQASKEGNAELLSVYLSQLQRGYPDDTESIREVEAMLNVLLGIDEGLTEEQKDEADRILLETAKDAIVDILSCVAGEPDYKNISRLTIVWKNKSAKTVSQIRITVVGYDENGDTVPGYMRDTDTLALRSIEDIVPGQERELTFLNLWEGPAVVRVAFEKIIINYTDGTRVTIDSTVLRELFP